MRSISRRRRAVVALVAAIALLLGLLPAQAATAKAKPAATVTVSISAVPMGSKASILLTGPKGFKKRFSSSSSKTFKGLQVGTYSATAGKIVVKKAKKGVSAGTYTADVSGPVTVAVGQKGVITVAYKDVVAPNVKVAAPSAVESTTVSDPSPGNTGTLVLNGARYRAGDVVVSGVTPATPEGLLARVVRVQGTQNGATTYQVQTVSLQDVVPSGDFTVPLSGTATLDGDSPGSTNSLKHRQNGEVPNPFLRNFSCEHGASLIVDARLTAGVKTEYHADWSLWHPTQTSLTVGATASLTGHVGATVTGAASCTLDPTDLGRSIPLGTATVVVGGVPVVLVQSMTFFVEGEAQAQATLATSADAGASVRVEATASRAGLRTGYSGPDFTNSYQPPSLTADGSASLALGVRFNSKVYGLAGPYVTAKVGPELKADIHTNPWWTLDARMRLGIGVSGFGIDQHDDHLIDRSMRLADAGQAFPIGDGGSGDGSGGSGGSGGTGSGPGGTTGGTALRTILSYGVGPDLNCALYSNEDAHGEFFANTACGTFASVDGTLYRPASIPAGGNLGGASASENWTPVSQTDTGSGTGDDPHTVTTTADAGTSGMRITQTDRWAADGTSIPNTIRLRNSTSAAKTVRLYRGFDCYIGDDDTGTGELRLSGQLAGCLRSTSDGSVVTLRLQALTPGATVTESGYSDVWSQIAAQGDLNNGCRCSEDIDNGVGAGWAVTVPANSSVVLQSEVSMTRP